MHMQSKSFLFNCSGQGAIALSLRVLCQEATCLAPDPVNPVAGLLPAVVRVFPEFDDGGQHDARQFFEVLLDACCVATNQFYPDERPTEGLEVCFMCSWGTTCGVIGDIVCACIVYVYVRV